MYEFRLPIKKIEERFAKAYDAEKVSAAKVEAQMEPEEKSVGWFVVLDGWPIAIRLGAEKPDLKEGQTMSITMKVIP